ncbi:hypothetical protein ACF073_23835 [Streptomyces sp. NPDC015171]
MSASTALLAAAGLSCNIEAVLTRPAEAGEVCLFEPDNGTMSQGLPAKEA